LYCGFHIFVPKKYKKGSKIFVCFKILWYGYQNIQYFRLISALKFWKMSKKYVDNPGNCFQTKNSKALEKLFLVHLFHGLLFLNLKFLQIWNSMKFCFWRSYWPISGRRISLSYLFLHENTKSAIQSWKREKRIEYFGLIIPLPTQKCMNELNFEKKVQYDCIVHSIFQGYMYQYLEFMQMLKVPRKKDDKPFRTISCFIDWPKKTTSRKYLINGRRMWLTPTKMSYYWVELLSYYEDCWF
jgi:hypothetical protein